MPVDMNTARILVVDDEPQIRRFLKIALGAAGFEVVEAATGDEAVRAAATLAPAMIVLDLGLPDLDGTEVIGRIRDWSNVPILVLSVRADEAGKVGALDRGADDYVTKPFGIAELTARIRATLRARGTSPAQPGQAPAAAEDEALIRIGPRIIIDQPRHEVMLDGQPVKLSRREYDLLRTLARNRGRMMTHAQLLREVWGPAHEADTHYLRIYVGHLRQKLGDDPADPKLIVNEPGVGYRLEGG
ncbi:response regulator [Tistrella mobilis]